MPATVYVDWREQVKETEEKMLELMSSYFSRDGARKPLRNVPFKEIADNTFKNEEQARTKAAHAATIKRIEKLQKLLEEARQAEQARRNSLAVTSEDDSIPSVLVAQGDDDESNSTASYLSA